MEFAEDKPLVAEPAHEGEALVVDLDVYEGPLDVLLALAREQKVDLTRISILKLADQYIAFIESAHDLRLELAADYLVMAAWLAYLKSRLLLPEPEVEEDGLSGEEMAEALTYRLRRLEAMREAGAKIMALPRLGLDVFPRGAPEPVPVVKNEVYNLSLFELLRAYGEQRRKAGAHRAYAPPPTELYAIEEALARIERMLGKGPDWHTLMSFMPQSLQGGVVRRSAMAAMLSVGLEMTKNGQAELRQSSAFGPIYLRRRTTP